MEAQAQIDKLVADQARIIQAMSSLQKIVNDLINAVADLRHAVLDLRARV